MFSANKTSRQVYQKCVEEGHANSLFSKDFILEVMSVSSLVLSSLPRATVTYLLPAAATLQPLPEVAIPFQLAITVLPPAALAKTSHTDSSQLCLGDVCDARNKTEQHGKGCLKFSFSLFMYKGFGNKSARGRWALSVQKHHLYLSRVEQCQSAQ